MDAVHTQGLTYRFDGTHGVAGVDLVVPEGGIYGFLGPNGAGKTTTIRLLLGLLRPQAGSVVLFGRERGMNDPEATVGIGALVESPSLYPNLSGRENLEVTRCLLGASRRRIDVALDRVDLLEAGDRKAGTYSLGMRQRLGLALAILSEPRLLILDEPGNGLDPAGTLEMRALIRSLANDSGITVLLSSHQLSEVEQVATHIGVLHDGRLCFQGSMGELQSRLHGRLLIRGNDPQELLAHLQELGGYGRLDGEGGVCVTDSRHEDSELLRLLITRGARLDDFHRERPTLESLFFDLTGSSEDSR